jgi:hypothetical protein
MSFKTNNISVATDTLIAINASILPITEFEVNELIVITITVIPPAIKE